MNNKETLEYYAAQSRINNNTRAKTAREAVYQACAIALTTMDDEDIEELNFDDLEVGVNLMIDDGEVGASRKWWDAAIIGHGVDDFTMCTLKDALRAEVWYDEEWATVEI